MIYVMDSRVFFDAYCKLENPTTVLDAWYVVCSLGKITRGRIEMENVRFMPSLTVRPQLLSLPRDEIELAYKNDLEEPANMHALARICKFSYSRNIVILTTERESDQVPFLKWLSDFILEKFELPVIDYLSFVMEECDVPEWDMRNSLFLINQTMLATYAETDSEDTLQNIVLGMSKKELKDILKYRGLYDSDMTKEEMVDLLIRMS